MADVTVFSAAFDGVGSGVQFLLDLICDDRSFHWSVELRHVTGKPSRVLLCESDERVFGGVVFSRYLTHPLPGGISRLLRDAWV